MSGKEDQSLLDDEGRLFGLVNIVDVLVVLLFLAVIVAGVALLLPSGGGESETRYATINLGQQSTPIAEVINPGDEWTPEGTSDSLVITDVYRFDTQDGTQVVVRAQVNGTATEPADPDEDPTFLFRDQPLQLGQELSIQTDEYSTTGTVQEIQQTGDTLPLSDSAFVVETTLTPEEAGEIDTGDQFQVAGNTVAEIDNLAVFPQADGSRYALVGLTATTIKRSGDQFFGSTRISVGRTVTFDGDGYEVSGAIVRRGNNQIQRSDTSVVVETSLSPETADILSVGDEFTLGEETAATIESLELFPSGGGDQRYALLGLNLKTFTRNGSPQFAGQSVRVGASVPFQTDEYQFAGQVLTRGTTTMDTEQHPFVIQTTVPTAVADTIRAGDTYDIAGRNIVNVESVTVYPTADADTRRVVMGVTAKVQIEGGTLLFGDRELRTGSQIPVETGAYSISGEVVRRGTTEEPGEPTTRTITLQLDNVRPERADVITTGMEERTRDQTTAEVRSVSEEPADVILESEDGDIFLRQHPKNKDLELTVELSVRELNDGSIRFRGQTLRAGQTLALELGQITIQGEVIEFTG